MILLAELNQLDTWATDFGNEYLETNTSKKVYITTGKELREKQGNTLNIYIRHYMVFVQVGLGGIKNFQMIYVIWVSFRVKQNLIYGRDNPVDYGDILPYI